MRTFAARGCHDTQYNSMASERRPSPRAAARRSEGGQAPPLPLFPRQTDPAARVRDALHRPITPQAFRRAASKTALIRMLAVSGTVSAAAPAVAVQLRGRRTGVSAPHRRAVERSGALCVRMSASLEPQVGFGRPCSQHGAPRGNCSIPHSRYLQVGGDEEVFIRRRRPSGQSKLDCGPTFDFLMESVDKEGNYVENLENKPRNILEEIVWYKDTEIAQVRLPGCPCPLCCGAASAWGRQLTLPAVYLQFKEVESLAQLKRKTDVVRLSSSLAPLAPAGTAGAASTLHIMQLPLIV